MGSPSLGEFARAHQDLLQADACLWEAGTRNEQGSITITAGLKGLLSVELRVQSVAYDLQFKQCSVGSKRCLAAG